MNNIEQRAKDVGINYVKLQSLNESHLEELANDPICSSLHISDLNDILFKAICIPTASQEQKEILYNALTSKFDHFIDYHNSKDIDWGISNMDIKNISEKLNQFSDNQHNKNLYDEEYVYHSYNHPSDKFTIKEEFMEYLIDEIKKEDFINAIYNTNQKSIDTSPEEERHKDNKIEKNVKFEIDEKKDKGFLYTFLAAALNKITFGLINIATPKITISTKEYDPSQPSHAVKETKEKTVKTNVPEIKSKRHYTGYRKRLDEDKIDRMLYTPKKGSVERATVPYMLQDQLVMEKKVTTVAETDKPTAQPQVRKQSSFAENITEVHQ